MEKKRKLGNRIGLLIVLVVILSNFIYADGWNNNLAHHETLYADTVTSKTTGQRVIVSDPNGLEVFNNAYFATVSGNVGIGTTGPLSPLHVGHLTTDTVGRFSSADNRGGIVLADNTGATSMYRDSSMGGFFIDASGSATSDLFISTTGNVGIGTTSPSSKIHLQSGGLFNSFLYGSGFSGVDKPWIGFNALATMAAVDTIDPSWDGALISTFTGNVDTGTNLQIGFVDQSTETYNAVMHIRKDGNVGIGTTAPLGNLHIYAATGEVDPFVETGDADVAAWRYQNINSYWKVGVGINGVDGFVFREIDPSGQRMTILSGGNVGIGTTAPGHKLNIHSGAAGSFSALSLTSSDIGTIGNSISQVFGFTDSTYQKGGIFFESMDANARGKMHIALNSAADSSNVVLSDAKVTVQYNGNVGIGTTLPQTKLHVYDGNFRQQDTTGGKTGQLTISTFGSGSLIQETNSGRLDLRAYETRVLGYGDGLIDLIVNNIGNVGIGRTPAANKLEVEGDASKTTAGSWLANSDIRIKEDVQELQNGIEVINRLNPVKFRYKGDYREDHSIEDKFYYNFIAQEFQEVFPESVKDDGDGYLQIDTYVIRPYLVVAVQELDDRDKEKQDQISKLIKDNQELKEENKVFKSEIGNLKKRVNLLEK